MKYRFFHLPNTEHATKFRVKSQDGKNESDFNFSKAILSMWGNPLEDKLEELMIAYLKRNGWGKQPVNVTTTESPKNLNQYIASLGEKVSK